MKVQGKCKKCEATLIPLESTVTDLCPTCVKVREEEDLEKIKRYLEGHPHDTLIDIVCGTGVTMSRVRKLIVNGRLDRRKQPRD